MVDNKKLIYRNDYKSFAWNINEVFLNIRKYLNQGNLSSKLKGPVKQMGFYKTK